MDHKKFQITGNQLKIIAMISMFLDHGAAILLRGYGDIYLYMRMIGRVAFPIYCFLLVEGFYYTRNKKRYILRLGVFAFITEPIFDLALGGKIVDLGHQNTMFSLLIGMIMLWGVESIPKKWGEYGKTAVFAAACFFAYILKTDYGYLGIALIYILYRYREHKLKPLLAGLLMFGLSGWPQVLGTLAFIPIHFYHGIKGTWNLKYFFYLFYPGHLLLLYVIGSYL